MVCIPFIEINVEDYFKMLEEITDKYKKLLKKHKESGNMEQIPYVLFLELSK